jgi:hypothetical protein
MKTFADFWPFYLREHSKPLTRSLHFAGTSTALAVVAAAAITGRGWLLVAALLAGYGSAWVGHFFIEKNRPATFQHPLWSFAADFKMLGCAITGRLGAELQRAGVSPAT